MINRGRRRVHILRLAVLACAIGGIFITAQQVRAGVTAGRGYFLDRSAAGTLQSFTACGIGSQSWHKVVCAGAPATTDKAKYIRYVLDLYGSGDSHKRLAGAFIIFTMLGYDNHYSGTTPSRAQIQEWQDRINNPRIRIRIKSITAYPNSAYVKYARDGRYDMAYINQRAVNVQSLVFEYDGDDVYYLKISCANPIGNTPGLPKTGWNNKGVSSVTPATASIGDTVTFKHTIENTGANKVSNSPWSTHGDVAASQTGMVSLNAGEKKLVSTETFTIPGDIGLKTGDVICRYITYRDSEANDVNVNSKKACVTITSSFDLYPVVKSAAGDNPGVLTIGGTMDTDEIMENISITSDRPIPYEVHEFVMYQKDYGTKPNFADVFDQDYTSPWSNAKYANASYGGTDACTTWLKSKNDYKKIACKQLANVADAGPFNYGQVMLPDLSDINADDYSPGDMVCRFMSVGYYNSSITDALSHRASYPVCVIIAKQPNLQVWGNDIRAGDSFYPAGTQNGTRDDSSIYTRTMFSGGNTYGSWGEYGIFAPLDGEIESVSGGVVSGNTGFPGVPAVGVKNPLSFANINAAEPGHYAAARQLASFTEAFKQVPSYVDNSSRAAYPLNNDADVQVNDHEWKRVVIENGSSQLTVRGNFKKQATLVLEFNGTVRIDQDITLDRQDYSQIGDAAQIIIVARNIIIESQVKRVDAWLVATPSTAVSNDGVISTCDQITSPYYAGLSLQNNCNNNQLRINGAVVAREVQLRRSYGATKDDYGAPAEIINLRPDAYMWGSRSLNGTPGQGVPMETAFTKELPPRF